MEIHRGECTSSSPMGMKAKNYARDVARKFYHETSPNLQYPFHKIEEATRCDFEDSCHVPKEKEDTFWLSNPSSNRTRLTQFHRSVEVYWITKLSMA